jgi:small-conductance mechanosensitive channel
MDLEFFRYDFLNNRWELWCLSAAIFFAILATVGFLRAFFIRRLQSTASLTPTLWDDVLLELLENTHLPFVLVMAVHFASQGLSLHVKWQAFSKYAFFLVLFVQVGAWATRAIQFLGNAYADKTLAVDAGKATTVKAMVFFGKILVWTLVGILVLDNWNVKVAPFVAGLGIGGIAIALAVQNILGDLFASLSIVLDKPFVIGDPIKVDQDSGVVEYIGLKTTRLKSATGEQLIFSNSELLKSRIRNYQRMPERRVTVKIGVEYHTPVEELRKLPDVFRACLEKNGLRMERANLVNLGDSALEFEICYWVQGKDPDEYFSQQHNFFLAVLAEFQAKKIGIAFPTRTIHMEMNNGSIAPR